VITERVREDPVLGRVRFCDQCFIWQPDDAEFWINDMRKAGSEYSRADGRTYVRRSAVNVMKCRACVNERTRLRRERLARLNARVQQRPYKVKVVLGPCGCHDCHVSLYWNGVAWFDIDGRRHSCPRGLAA
jgi:hypothetical protein